MRISYFNWILISLILVLGTRGVVTFVSLEQKVRYALKTGVNSELIGSAYATETNTQATGSINIQNTNIPNSEVQKKAATVLQINADTELEAMGGADNLILKQLTGRKAKLDKTAADLSIQEQVLKSTETKVEQKIQELSSLQTKVTDLLQKHNQQENLKIKSLVKIYENMKPKDAAKIFDELDMPVLLSVISQMREFKSAPIMANMNPVKAKELSMEFAKNRSLLSQPQGGQNSN